MSKLARDQAGEELLLMMGGGAAVGFIPLPIVFTVGISTVEFAVVNRIARIYDVDIVAAGGVASLAAAVMAAGGGNFLHTIAGEIANYIPIPFLKEVVKPVIGAGAVGSFGVATIAYFENLYPGKLYGPATPPQVEVDASPTP